MVHDAVYSYCWWYTMLYTATVDGTRCCIQLLLMVHDAVYSYCWWYAMLYTATADGTWFCIQLLLIVHDVAYSYCWFTWCCIQQLLIQLVQSGMYWTKLAYINMTLGPVTENRIINGGQMSRCPHPPFPLRTETVPGSQTSRAAHITTARLHSNTQKTKMPRVLHHITPILAFALCFWLQLAVL